MDTDFLLTVRFTLRLEQAQRRLIDSLGRAAELGGADVEGLVPFGDEVKAYHSGTDGQLQCFSEEIS